MRLFCAALFAICLSAQPGSGQYGSISGIVIDSDNKPVARAIVTLSTTGAHPQDAVAWTDSAGRFAFAYLPPGPYRLFARNADFVSAAFGTATRRTPTPLFHLRAGENRSDFVCRLPKPSSISGVVIDQDGDPVSSARIMALQSVYRRATRQLVQAGVAQADAQGHYRFANLRPGRYVVCVEGGRMGWVGGRSEVSAKDAPVEYMHPNQCYPGAESAKSATFLQVQAGKEISGVDFHAALVPAISVHGSVVPPDGFDASKVNVSVEAMQSDLQPGAMHMGVGVDPRTLEFTFPPLAPGSYTFIARAEWQGKKYEGLQQVQVQSPPPENITIPLDQGVSLSGTVQVVGPDAAQRPMEFVGLVPGDFPRMRGDNLRTKVGPDGAFKFENVPPGIWDINVGPIPRGGYIKSMMLGKQDVLTEEMRITGSTSARLTIVVSTQGATLKGDVTNGQDRPTPGVVVLAPAGKGRELASFYRVAQIDDEGRFDMTGIPAGAYRLFAFDEFDFNSQGPEGLEPFAERGVKIDLKEGQTLSQKLHVIAASAGGNP